MKTEKRKNSALKKLVPAVAMLATSAVMLSTATYAWFTMNKEVKMTGLNMTATVGEGIEIALAEVDSTSLTFPTSGGTPDDKKTDSWKSAVVVGNYYESIGKIKPASSVDGENFYDATNASQGGKVASTFKKVDAASTNPTSFIKTRATLDTSENAQKVGSNDETGYYVDIPVHIRTSKVQDTANSITSGDLYCKMIINNNGATGEGNTLYEAVRVAFVPITTGTGSVTNILGVDDKYYEGEGANAKAVNSENSKDSVTVLTTNYVTSADFSGITGGDSGLNLPYAGTAGEYGHLDFYVRVWLEGESKSCYDDKAGQSWNIDIAFSLGEFTTTQGN